MAGKPRITTFVERIQECECEVQTKRATASRRALFLVFDVFGTTFELRTPQNVCAEKYRMIADVTADLARLAMLPSSERAQL